MRYFIILLLFLCCHTVLAQEKNLLKEEEVSTQRKYADLLIQVTFGMGNVYEDGTLIGFNNNIADRQSNINRTYRVGLNIERIRNNLGFRIGLAYDRFDKRTHSEGVFVNPQISSSFRNENNILVNSVIVLGGLTRYVDVGKYKFGLGFEIPYRIFFEHVIFSENESKSVQMSQQFSQISENMSKIEQVRDGGFAIGLNLFASLQFSLSEHWILGAKFSPGYRYLDVGGETKFDSFNRNFTETNSNGLIIISEFSSFNEEIFDDRLLDYFDYYYSFAISIGFIF